MAVGISENPEIATIPDRGTIEVATITTATITAMILARETITAEARHEKSFVVKIVMAKDTMPRRVRHLL